MTPAIVFSRLTFIKVAAKFLNLGVGLLIRTQLLVTDCDLFQNRVMGMKPKQGEYSSSFVSKGVWTLV